MAVTITDCDFSGNAGDGIHVGRGAVVYLNHEGRVFKLSHGGVNRIPPGTAGVDYLLGLGAVEVPAETLD